MSEYIIEIPDYVPPFDPATRAVSFGEEIVRCRDCKRYREEIRCVGGELHRCGHWGDWTTPDGFCAYGKRRDA